MPLVSVDTLSRDTIPLKVKLGSRNFISSSFIGLKIFANTQRKVLKLFDLICSSVLKPLLWLHPANILDVRNLATSFFY
jgi:hypothetical protein